MSIPVFISYSTDDTSIAEQLRDGLEAASIPCWMAPRDIVPGREYAEQILDAIEACSVMVLLVSETSNQSRFVRSEVERAVSKDKVIIPVRIHDVTLTRSLEFFISSAQWIDALAGAEAVIPTLTAALRQYMPAISSPATDEAVAADRPHNLPNPATPFVGRSREIDEILSQLREPDCRLLTLLGQGGMGKTRLAIETARHFYADMDAVPDGVFFAALETFEQPEQILPAIVSALGLPVGMGEPQRQLQSFLGHRALLLILDNFEHLLDGAGLLTEILSMAPQVKIVVTSRETLNLPGEWTYPVGGMELPQLRVDPLEQTGQSDAVQLFMQAARRARPTLDLRADLPHIIEICRLVEGSPLALGLAAHWLRTIPCAQVVEELRKGLDLLATPARGIPQRHSSMRAVFDYSWRLAGEDERKVLCQLPVFVGGFDWPAFRAVTQGTLPLLAALVESSWLQVDDTGRYTLHPLVRSYLAEKLEQGYADRAGEEPPAIRERHALYYAGEVAVSGPEFLSRERDNAVAGFRQATAVLNADCLSLYTRGTIDWPLPVADKRALFGAAIDRVRAERTLNPPGDAMRSMLQLEILLMIKQALFLRRAWLLKEAQELVNGGLTLLDGLPAHETEKDHLHFRLLEVKVIIEHYQGTVEEVHSQEYEKLAARLGNEQEGVVHGRARHAELQGDYGLAEEYYIQERSLAVSHVEESGASELYRSTQRLGRVLMLVGDYSQASIHFEESGRMVKSIFEQIEAGADYAGLELATGRPAMAIEQCQPLLRSAEEYGYALGQLACLEILGRASLALNRLDDAESYFQQMHDLTEQTRRSRLRALALLGLGRVASARGAYAQSEILYREAVAVAWPSRFRPEMLSALMGLAEIELQAGHGEKALQWLAIVARHPATVHIERVHAQKLMEGIEAEKSETEGIDPESALAEIVTALLASTLSSTE